MDEDHKHGHRLEYDPRWKGPLKGRSCTDCICLIIFLAFIGGWGATGWYAYKFGDVQTLLAPTDSEGRKCGHDEDVAGRKYLVFFDLTKCLNISVTTEGCDTPQVCVEKCPTDNFVFLYNATEALQNDPTNLTALKNSMICKVGLNLTDATIFELYSYVENNICASWYLESTSLTGRCIPNGIPEILVNVTMTLTELEDAAEYIQLLVQLEEILTKVYDDFMETRWTVLAILGCSAVLTLIYIVLIRWIATPVVFVSIVAVCGLLGYTTYRFALLYQTDYSTFWLTLTIICGVLLGIIVLVCIVLRNRIRLACQLIKEASKAVMNTTLSLVFPIFPWAIEIIIVAYAIVVAMYLFTLREQNFTVQLGGSCECPESLGYTNGSICTTEDFSRECRENNVSCISGGCYLNSMTRPWFSNYLQALNIVGVLWLIFFMSAFEEMVLAGTFATWYWTFKKSKVPFFTLTTSVWRTLRYHIGTLAFGSLIITICRLIRWVLEYIDSKLKQYDNELVAFFLKCMKCYFWLLEKFLKFINKNAYIMCAIHGKGFCRSARGAFNLLMRNILRVFVLDKITDWLLFIGKVLVTSGVAWGAWLYIRDQFPTINYLIVPVVLVAVGAYLVASVFFSVYSMAVDTLFLCFLEDSERNDGTPEKPYYMSKSLMRILRKS